MKFKTLMARILFSVAAVLSGVSVIAGCAPAAKPPVTGGEEPEKPEKSEYVSRVRTLENGRTYLEVDGKPYAIRGAQVRIDGLYNRSQSFPNAVPPLTDKEIEQYFSKAKELGINTLELALEWKQIEKTKDNYDFALVDKLLGFTNKYGLKCEFLWFSTNMCGYSHSFTVPDYICSDSETYPVFESSKFYTHMYGNVFHLVLNNENLMQREKLVLEKLMAHVSEWNRQNGEKNPLIGIQVHNESDGLLRWKLEQDSIKEDGAPADPKKIWQMTLDALDNAGKAVKSSDYKIYTRCNMTTSYNVGEFPQWQGKGFSPLDVLELEGIDIIGDDPYVTSPVAINDIVRAYSVNGNYPHIAENMGNYSSCPSMFLTAYQAGGSYMFYDLATPVYFVQINGNSSYQMDQGVYNPDFTDKPHTAQTRSIIRGIAAMDSVLPLVESCDFAAFNVLTEIPLERRTQTVNTSNISLTYRTENGGVAFAIEREGYVYLYSTKDCKFTVNNADITLKAEIGHFGNDGFVVEEEAYINPEISVSADKLYRIKIRKINEAVVSTANDNV